jgi:hypothetical protein
MRLARCSNPRPNPYRAFRAGHGEPENNPANHVPVKACQQKQPLHHLSYPLR